MAKRKLGVVANDCSKEAPDQQTETRNGNDDVVRKWVPTLRVESCEVLENNHCDDRPPCAELPVEELTNKQHQESEVIANILDRKYVGSRLFFLNLWFC